MKNKTLGLFIFMVMNGFYPALPVNAACLPIPGDVTLDGQTTVVDVQCSILTALWTLDDSGAAIPSCVPTSTVLVDLDCNATVNVTDVLVIISLTLGKPLSLAIDIDQDGCTNTCEETCPDWTCIGNSACPSEGSCFKSHLGKGCSIPSCCNVVCLKNPTCCTKAWDIKCDALATTVCAQPECGAPAGTCVGTVGTKKKCLVGGAVGTCFAPHNDGGCDFKDCCNTVCAEDPSCCDVAWDQLCVLKAKSECGFDVCPTTDGSCFLNHDAPGCTQSLTCNDVCTNISSCCSTSWTTSCATAADQLWPVPHCPGNFSCFSAHTSGNPGCMADACCSTVCTVDSFCCNVSWDTICKNEAITLCTHPACETNTNGSCYYAQDFTGCNTPDCCNKVCSTDPYCGDIQWDSTCAKLALAECAHPACPADGACLSPHAGPGCSGNSCCNAVCDKLPACCSGAWTSICVSLATTLCDSPVCPQPGSCFAEKDAVGCEDTACCEQVCADDPFCCDERWDWLCKEEAITACTDFGACSYEDKDPLGGCYSSHASPGCEDSDCCVQICELDSFCCATSWDSICVNEALQICCEPECLFEVDPDKAGWVPKQCGPDGCGGVCGTCEWNEECDVDGFCQPVQESEFQVLNCNVIYTEQSGPQCEKLSSSFCGDVAPLGAVKLGTGSTAKIRIPMKWCPHTTEDDPTCVPGIWRMPSDNHAAPLSVSLYTGGVLLKQVPYWAIPAEPETFCKTATTCEDFVGGILELPAMVGDTSVGYARVKVIAGE